LRHENAAGIALSTAILLYEAEMAGFEVFVTADKNLRYQQNLEGRRIAIVVIGNAQWRILQHRVDLVVRAVDAAAPGTYVEVFIPFR